MLPMRLQEVKFSLLPCRFFEALLQDTVTHLIAFGVIGTPVESVVFCKLCVNVFGSGIVGDQLSVRFAPSLELDQEFTDEMILFFFTVAHEPKIDREDPCGPQELVFWEENLRHAVQRVNDTPASQF